MYLGAGEMTNLAYLASSGLCIGAIACLSQQSTARVGNALGMMGVSTGIAATLGVVPASPALFAQLAGALSFGGRGSRKYIRHDR